VSKLFSFEIRILSKISSLLRSSSPIFHSRHLFLQLPFCFLILSLHHLSFDRSVFFLLITCLLLFLSVFCFLFYWCILLHSIAFYSILIFSIHSFMSFMSFMSLLYVPAEFKSTKFSEFRINISERDKIEQVIISK